MSLFLKEFANIEAEIPCSTHARVFAGLKSSLCGHPLILYGAGTVAGLALRICQAEGIKADCICDSRATGIHERSGLPIISPSELLAAYLGARVMITSWKYEREITENLIALGFPKEQIYPFRYPVRIPVHEFREKHLSGYAWAYDFFRDDISKKLVMDSVRAYLMSQPLSPASACEMYYEDGIISLGESEIFIDGGAYTGDSAQAFIRRTNGRYARIYSFEPDADICRKAEANLEKYPNVHVIPKGLWHCEDRLKFYSEGDGDSTFVTVTTKESGITAPVTSLDIFFAGVPDQELPTFIKMDIEGAEKEALLGAADILKRVKPKLAICAYHKPEDIYVLPKTILDIRDDYRFTLRQYDYGYCETILYAV
jgi:FkbM family methyltransferase